MKAARFAYERPTALAEALALLAEDAEERLVKCLAGGQSLGPMLNLRLVQPDLLVDLTRIPELARVEADGDWLVLGACTTHAAIEDGRVPDVTAGLLPAVARGIAYRAVRTRGTLGGSLAHADPAADWIACLAALGAEVEITGPAGRRRLAAADFVTGAFESALEAGEILDGVRLPRLGARARWGFYKVARKTGEFAQAIGALLDDPDRGPCRAVVGATASRPIVIADAGHLFAGGPPARFDRAAARAELTNHGLGADPVRLQLHEVALARAAEALT